ncbi:uncharacterized protein LOC112505099 [Cynara cardunculus var. scolymus]|uniref:uncharacterized protein LOC112505099 n=1 Tax=Cynara cardunculus var. scolymus TaxID=59895 RepID=UPI000D63170E|nr:uncharacterized protein LOC112505099 [Cynara cardunculus var. scolymus]
MGDFNEVRYANERKGSLFSFLGTNRFNDFIRDSGLIEVRSGGRKFTRMSADGMKHSKLDRYLVSSNFLSQWPMPSAEILPRYLSDHCPILFRSDKVDFDPTYFKFFNSWLGQPDFNLLVCDSWNSSPSPIYCPPIKFFMSKLKNLKLRIKSWKIGVNKDKTEQENSLKRSLDSFDIKVENTTLSMEEISSRKDILMKIKAMEENKVKELKQKARLRWVVDGEENSSFFHGIVNANRRSNFIHGISSNGVWVTDPSEVKQEAFNFFSERFRSRSVIRPPFLCNNFKHLSPEQASSLESNISLEEFRKPFGNVEQTRLLGLMDSLLRSFDHSGMSSRKTYFGPSNILSPLPP